MTFHSSGGLESDDPGRVADGGGVNLILWFWLREGGGTQRCWRMKQRQQTRLGSIRRKRDTT
jgi:hypothetical protein